MGEEGTVHCIFGGDGSERRNKERKKELINETLWRIKNVLFVQYREGMHCGGDSGIHCMHTVLVGHFWRMGLGE